MQTYNTITVEKSSTFIYDKSNGKYELIPKSTGNHTPICTAGQLIKYTGV
jgi:hypothetical protein